MLFVRSVLSVLFLLLLNLTILLFSTLFVHLVAMLFCFLGLMMVNLFK